jgi:hypothetical protein
VKKEIENIISFKYYSVFGSLQKPIIFYNKKNNPKKQPKKWVQKITRKMGAENKYRKQIQKTRVQKINTENKLIIFKIYDYGNTLLGN